MINDLNNSQLDYRNIPRNKLDRDIPKGRGMVKWAPFATLPEQFETIYQYIIDQNKIERPILSEDQLSELNFRLHQSLQLNQPVIVQYYDAGYFKSIELNIERIDAITFEVEGYQSHSSEKYKLSILDIIAISPS
ncbi:YolD-like family protein [Staphylococcus pasteuri]|uniref:YolD-like family protein n=1 Tax=Staphylococcus pasteuri TaxID=45972 RepID=UPI0032605FD6